MDISLQLSGQPQTLKRRHFLTVAGGTWLATLLAQPQETWAASHNVIPTITGFSGTDKKQVERALWMALDRCFKTNVIRLAGKRTHRSRGPAHDAKRPNDDVSYRRGKEAEDAIKYYAVLAMGPMLRMKQNGSCDFSISISAADLGGSNGRAQLGLETVWGYHLRDDNRRPHYVIQLDKQAVRERTIDGTAGTIFHEMLHNAGLTHRSGSSYEANYAGYLIKEWGLAIEANGQEGFGLVDDRYSRRGCG